MIFLCLLGFSLFGCGSSSTERCRYSSLAFLCPQPTPDEIAMKWIQLEAWDQAQAILEPLIVKEPQVYFRYPRLALVYAAQGGIDLLKLLQSDHSQQNMDESLPQPEPGDLEAYDEKLSKIKKAKDLLESMPIPFRSAETPYYGTSAAMQYILYLSAYSTMLLSRWKADGDMLSSLNPEVGREIFQSLNATAEAAQDWAPEVAAQVREVLDTIEAQDGPDEISKIKAFLGSLEEAKTVA